MTVNPSNIDITLNVAESEHCLFFLYLLLSQARILIIASSSATKSLQSCDTKRKWHLQSNHTPSRSQPLTGTASDTLLFIFLLYYTSHLEVRQSFERLTHSKPYAMCLHLLYSIPITPRLSADFVLSILCPSWTHPHCHKGFQQEVVAHIYKGHVMTISNLA